MLYKNFGEGKLPSSDLKGPKGKERAGTSRKGAGESGAAAGDSTSSSSSSGKKRGAKFCMCCGDRSHGTEDCKHPKASKISLVDGKLPRICFKCFKTGHSKKFCPGEGKTKGASGGETNDKASSGEAHAQLLIQKLYQKKERKETNNNLWARNNALTINSPITPTLINNQNKS